MAVPACNVRGASVAEMSEMSYSVLDVHGVGWGPLGLSRYEASLTEDLTRVG